MFREFGAEDILVIGRSAIVTIILCLSSGIIGSLVGVGLGVAAQARNPLIRFGARAYINIVRGIPLLVIIFLVYFGMPLLFDRRGLPAFIAAITALSLYAAAYMGEVVRGGLRSVEIGQWEASASLGLGFWSRIRYVVFPQAIPVMIPPGIGFLIALVKDSSLVSVVGLLELTGAGRSVGSVTTNPLLAFLVVAGFYFVVSYALSMLSLWYERRSDRASGSLEKNMLEGSARV